jgi:hypothetical protein
MQRVGNQIRNLETLSTRAERTVSPSWQVVHLGADLKEVSPIVRKIVED